MKNVTLDSLSFDFLWWFRLVAFFPGDMMREIQELGGDEIIAVIASRSEGTKKSDPIHFYNEFKSETWYTRYMERYIATWTKLNGIPNTSEEDNGQT